MARLMLLMACLGGCAWPADEWSEAVQLDTPAAYEAFLAAHPDTEHTADARVRRDALLDERDWRAAVAGNSPQSYSTYLAAHPHGVWAALALRRGEPAAPEVADQAAAEPELAPTPIGVEVLALEEAASPPAVAISEALHLVQLGTYSSATLARQSWERMQHEHAALASLQPVIAPVVQSGSTLHRLRVGLPTRKQARQLCADLARAGADCLASPPK